MSRKDTLRALLTARERRLPTGNSEDASDSVTVEPALKPLVRSGAVGAMGRSLGKIASAAEEARALIGSGTTIVELDPTSIEASFLVDRLEGSEVEHQELMASIQAHGQQVPILVRPHPASAGRYQVAYGHRRLRALAELGKPVRAVVKELSDAELVVAQGQENSARLDLSYIERALFAMAIEERGFDRNVLMAALSVEKTQLSRLISIGRSIPIEVIQAIGPAPKTGRPRWSALADTMKDRDWRPILAKLCEDRGFRTADSDSRFARFEAALSAKAKSGSETWTGPDGVPAAAITRSKSRLVLAVDHKHAPDFGEFIVKSLPDLYRRYVAERGKH